jgi:hypothetical protein
MRSQRLERRKKTVYEPIQLDNKQWLSNFHLDAFIRLLVKDFPALDGIEFTDFFSVRDSLTMNGDNRVFIVNTSQGKGFHWLVISNIDCPKAHWRVFSSLAYTTKFYKELFSAILPDLDMVFVIQENVEKQKDSINCGLYSLANAMALATGQNPVLFDWVTKTEDGEDAMRQHYRNCLANMKVSQFPSRPRRLFRAAKPEALQLKSLKSRK